MSELQRFLLKDIFGHSRPLLFNPSSEYKDPGTSPRLFPASPTSASASLMPYLFVDGESPSTPMGSALRSTFCCAALRTIMQERLSVEKQARTSAANHDLIILVSLNLPSSSRSRQSGAGTSVWAYFAANQKDGITQPIAVNDRSRRQIDAAKRMQTQIRTIPVFGRAKKHGIVSAKDQSLKRPIFVVFHNENTFDRCRSGSLAAQKTHQPLGWSPRTHNNVSVGVFNTQP